jgi:hypothetical protein
MREVLTRQKTPGERKHENREKQRVSHQCLAAIGSNSVFREINALKAMASTQRTRKRDQAVIRQGIIRQLQPPDRDPLCASDTRTPMC